MSVYTLIQHQQLEQFLDQYSLGTLIRFSGIQAGIENTNYRVTSSQGDFILTIFEALTTAELPCFLQLLNHLNQLDFPAPKPQACNEGGFINILGNKPATIFDCLPGQSIEQPTTVQCSEIGEYLARLHLLSPAPNFYKQNSKDLIGCQQIFNKLEPHLSRAEVKMINFEVNFQLAQQLPVLPKGIIHADLFRDNVLFNRGYVSGILDFYKACHGFFLFDLAVTCNDWCTENNAINQNKFRGILSGYQKIKPLNEDEKKHLSVFLRLAALSFWLSRLEHQVNPKKSELTVEKDPLDFRHLLEYHQSS